MTTIYVQLVKSPGGNYITMPVGPASNSYTPFRFILNDRQSEELSALIQRQQAVCWDLAQKQETQDAKHIYSNLMRDSLAMAHLSISMLVTNDFQNQKVSLVFPAFDGQHTWTLATLHDCLVPMNPNIFDVPSPERWPEAPEDQLPWE